MQHVPLHSVTTDDVQARFDRLARDMGEARDTIRTLTAQIEAARKRLEAAEGAQRHAGAVLAWRKRSGTVNGDPITELIGLQMRLVDPHRLLRLQQQAADGDKPATVSLLIRTPQGLKVKLTYHGWLVKAADLPDGTTIPLGAALDARMNHAVLGLSWPELGSSQTWMVKASRQKPTTYIEVAGDLMSVEYISS